MPLLGSENILPSKAKAGLSQPHRNPWGRWSLCGPCADSPGIADQPAPGSREQEWWRLGQRPAEKAPAWDTDAGGRGLVRVTLWGQLMATW